MKHILRKCIAVTLCLTILSGQALALTAAERFRQAAQLINTRGLIAEQSPIPQQTIDTEAAYLEQNPDALSDVLNEILGAMDTHSMYLPASSYQTGFSTLAGYAGIGIAVQQKEEGMFIQQVTKHSPAARAGLQVGDRLTSVNGKSIADMALKDVGTLLQGDVGTRVQLSVVRDGRTLQFNLIRETILDENVSFRQAAPGVAYISISAFSSLNDVEDFAEIWNQLDDNKTHSVILDLRDNGGGMVDAAIAMLQMMLEKPGLMVTMHYRADQGGDQPYQARGGGLPLNQMIVLVNQNTASAAELMAGVLHEVGGATLMGAQSYGKGQGQYHLRLDGDYLILTCMEMRLPKSGAWEGIGLTPDVQAEPTRTIRSLYQIASSLNTNTTLRAGQSGTQVSAVCQRLHMLGYLRTPVSVMNTDTMRALNQFQQDAGLPVQNLADPATLQALDAACRRAAEQALYVDDVYYQALDLCKTAAKQSLRYQPLADGSWRAA